MPAIESRATEAALPPAPTGTAAAAPRIWLLLDDRPGHITQVVGLAEALGWPYETKALRFTPLNRLSNRLLGASRLSLDTRSEEHTSELQSLMRISYAVFCLKKKKSIPITHNSTSIHLCNKLTEL